MRARFVDYGVGIVFSVLIALAALWWADYIPLGAVALAIVLGILLGNLTPINRYGHTGITFSEKHLLSIAIALMGVNLDFGVLQRLGWQSIVLVVMAMGVTIGSAILLGRVFGLDRRFAMLLGIGNGVCGSSAIVATEQVIGARKEDVALSIAIVNFLGTIGIFLLPFVSVTLLHFGDINSGILSGNTLQAVGQVIAAGFSISDTAGQTATLVKMTRILMLFPLLMVLIYTAAHSRQRNSSVDLEHIDRPAFPIFIVGFVLTALIASLHVLPEDTIHLLSRTSHYLLITAMAAIGLKITFKTILQHGRLALGIGSMIFAVQILFSGVAIMIFFR
jgi:uncharacterized integral membrane protein (TIGR00698 family)